MSAKKDVRDINPTRALCNNALAVFLFIAWMLHIGNVITMTSLATLLFVVPSMFELIKIHAHGSLLKWARGIIVAFDIIILVVAFVEIGGLLTSVEAMTYYEIGGGALFGAGIKFPKIIIMGPMVLNCLAPIIDNLTMHRERVQEAKKLCDKELSKKERRNR